MKIALVGGGSSAHVLAPLLSKSGHSVYILTRRPREWHQELELFFQLKGAMPEFSVRGKLFRVSGEPHEIIPFCDIVLLCMPVHQYRNALRWIAPYIRNESGVFVGTVYGQGNLSWMSKELKEHYPLDQVCWFSFGLLPWICRTIAYGKSAVTYGSKFINCLAISSLECLEELRTFLYDVCEHWFGQGKFLATDNFLSLSLSVDNQVIHPARCFGLFKRYGMEWDREEDIPFFYRDFDDLSAEILANLDQDYSKIRRGLKKRFPQLDWQYMLDYLELERFSYHSCNTDIKKSFTDSSTLGRIKPPVIFNNNGKYALDRGHRFFLDDFNYGLCIAKWFADKMNMEVGTIDDILEWGRGICGESYVISPRFHIADKDIATTKYGIPPSYGLESLESAVIFE